MEPIWGAERKPWGKTADNPADRAPPRCRALHRLDHGDSAEIMEIERAANADRSSGPGDAGEAVTLQVVHSPEKAREIHRGECAIAGMHFATAFVTSRGRWRATLPRPLKATWSRRRSSERSLGFAAMRRRLARP